MHLSDTRAGLQGAEQEDIGEAGQLCELSARECYRHIEEMFGELRGECPCRSAC